MKELYEAQGDNAQVLAMAAARKEHCGNPADNEDQD